MSLWIAICIKATSWPHNVIVRLASCQNIWLCIDFPNLKATDAKSDHTTALDRKEGSIVHNAWIYIWQGRKRGIGVAPDWAAHWCRPCFGSCAGAPSDALQGQFKLFQPINLFRAAGASKLIQLKMKMVHTHSGVNIYPKKYSTIISANLG